MTPSDEEEYAATLSGAPRQPPRDLQPYLSASGEPAFSKKALGPRTVGDYRIERELGRGGMGVVFLALNLKLQRWVALKLLNGAEANIAI